MSGHAVPLATVADLKKHNRYGFAIKVFCKDCRKLSFLFADRPSRRPAFLRLRAAVRPPDASGLFAYQFKYPAVPSTAILSP